MVDADIVARRLLALNESLAELSRPECADARRLSENSMLRAAVERWLQVAIESCIDIAYHVCSTEGWTPPATARDAFISLSSHSRIEGELAARLGSAVGLRNLLVHEYASLDLQQLSSVVRNDLDDLRRFGALAGQWLEASE